MLKCSDLSEVTEHGIRFESESNVISLCKPEFFLEKVVKPFLLWYLTLRCSTELAKSSGSFKGGSLENVNKVQADSQVS